MLTLITGTPGAGKSLYAVWELARKVPGSTIEDGQNPVPRKLYSNVKNLLVEHEHIDGDDLNRWHEWVKPGDVILFDEVQEVWRPRGLGTKVPDCIAKLETHRHMGVDIILVTQHPMLVDPNIRRLVNQHIHMRRITKTIAMRYEWDHCENPGNTRTCVGSGVWMHPKKAYGLYKSAQLHTKPVNKFPKIAWLGVAALAGLAYAGPVAFDRLSTSLGQTEKQVTQQNEETKPAPGAPVVTVENGLKVTTAVTSTQGPPPGLDLQNLPQAGGAAPVGPAVQEIAGCIAVKDKCGCQDKNGLAVPVTVEVCREKTGYGLGQPVKFADSPPAAVEVSQAEIEAIKFAFGRSPY